MLDIMESYRNIAPIVMQVEALLRSDKEIWDRYAGAEEYGDPIRDIHGRFPRCLSRTRDALEPVASKLLIERGIKFSYPDGKKFALCMTHDIDTVSSTGRDALAGFLRIVRSGDVRNGIRPAAGLVSKKYNDRWNFGNIMDLEKKYRSKSTFFFMATDKDLSGRVYDPGILKKEIRSIIERGWEVGLHGGYYSYNSPTDIKAEKERLEKIAGETIIGYRNHYLRFQTPDTWRLLSDAGFLYDSTVGYADCVGFRNGMCHVFTPYDLSSERAIPIREIPLAIMDSTLFDYMKLAPDTAWELTKRLIDTARTYSGVLTILWHNTKMDGEMLEFYERILKYGHGKGAFMSGGEEILKGIRVTNGGRPEQGTNFYKHQ